eukprot:CAMPEP_0118662000 /NCGR_PEP_ID=MMETSP0785-20121206/16587_1 /TAXON_ID=91992 /ORGANISM="Bolidomonas pacifica, Strain CCMP 1866" /LENGTH=164 /DNA_ID=CAMNT_0006555493 /DNA_START=167 /DNA_END=657 /DNA_ORIENTATION=+
MAYSAYAYKVGTGEENIELEKRLRQDYKKHQAAPQTKAARIATMERLRQMHSNDAEAQKELGKALRGGKNSQREIKSLNRTPLVLSVKSEEEKLEEEDTNPAEGKKKSKKKIRQIRRRLTSSRGGKRAGSDIEREGLGVTKTVAIAGIVGTVMLGVGVGLGALL